MSPIDRKTEAECIDALRFLACDAIEKARSGHPGLPLGAATAAYTLWTRHLRHDPTDPAWPDRDRFVLSAGHGSALLYALLHLSGYDVPLAQLEAFRQRGSLTPGHPESHLTPGVEVTTGPLGQGLGNAVGLALAEAHLAAVFNRPERTIVDHRTYVLVGDGDLMEGVAYEACALAGHLGLAKLTVLFDSNRISLAGSTSLVTSEDIEARFNAAGWQTITVDDGDSIDQIDAALTEAAADGTRPSIVILPTTIGRGAPTKQGSFKVHGAPLGPEELSAAKAAAGWPSDRLFFVPDSVRAAFAEVAERGQRLRAAWLRCVDDARADQPDLVAEFERRLSGRLPNAWADDLPSFPADEKGMATRKASEAVLQTLAEHLPEVLGGSADLDPSTYTWLEGHGDFQVPGARPSDAQGEVGGAWDHTGRNIHFGVREHAMGAIVNGMAQHGGLIPYSATFLVFADYMRPSIRLASLSRYPSVFVFTHDSIGVGEDGPTHQPVEQITSLRLIPNLEVLRPADANETVEAWRLAIERRDGPTALIFSRQALPTLDRNAVASAAGLRRGAYTLWESGEHPNLILIATGSEVHLALEAARELASESHTVRVVSMPSWERFDAQAPDYRESVLPAQVGARIAIEAGRSIGWDRYVGTTGRIIAVDRFGASAPGKEVFALCGVTVDAIVEVARDLLDV